MKKMPLILEDYLNYMEAIKGVSPNTAKEYYYDLRGFFRFLKRRHGLIDDSVDFDDIPIGDIDVGLIKDVTIQDLHGYISFVDRQKDNQNAAKSRKVSSLRSFFTYLHSIVSLINDNPADKLEYPKTSARHPVYLTLDESRLLLNTIQDVNKNEFIRKRDYAIVLLFLNCGLRLSELSSIDMDKVKSDTLTVIGKGNKERTIYLNPSCLYAINDYLTVRPKDVKDDKQALFVSIRKQRMSNRAIQHRIDKYLELAGFDTSVYSTHKLRHTAATLMYKHGDVDIRALQEILGHENVATTQIYTHIDDDRLRKAINSNPLGEFSPHKEE